jgi:DNA end-binding protein Ku
MAMIKEKLKGHKPVVAAEPERANVVDLMAALKASLGQGKPPAKSRRKAAGEPAAEEPPAKATGTIGRGRRAKGKA